MDSVASFSWVVGVMVILAGQVLGSAVKHMSGSLQYRTLMDFIYRFPQPIKLPIMI